MNSKLIHPNGKKIILIGVTGHAGSGKDTFVEMMYSEFAKVEKEFILEKDAMANPLKEVCGFLFGFTIEQLGDRAFKEAPLKEWGVSPRQLLQFVGTELFRQGMIKLIPDIGEGFWVKVAQTRITEALKEVEDAEMDCVVMYSDVRFNDEADWIRQNQGYIIHLTRPGYEGIVGIQSHASESGVSRHPDDLIVTNAYGLDYLRERAVDITFQILGESGIV